MDCGMWCVFSERRRHVERLWRRRLLVTSDERRARRRFLRLMRGFDAEDVEVIRKAVESDGVDSKACAPGPPMDERVEEDPPDEDSGLIPQIDRPMSMPYLCCKLWRWKDLQVDAALHRLEALPWCRFGRVTINNATVSCCNPYHYALWIRPETNGGDDDGSEDKNSSVHQNNHRSSLIGNGHITYRHRDHTHDAEFSKLPKILSGELPDRPPPSVPTATPPVPDDSPPCTSRSSQDPDDLIHYHHHESNRSWAKMTRYERKEQIGDTVWLHGAFAAVGVLSKSVHDAQLECSPWDLKNEVSFALIRQADPIGSTNPEDVWLYNSGTRPLFLSMTPNVSSTKDTLRRLSPGYCIRVHRGEVSASAPASERTKVRRPSKDPALAQQNLVISVGKGWGPNYSRLYLTDIPCRYEVSFA
ncbi:Protein CBR-TAG-68 [Caenorhabditis briggsae]|uniref:Dwarfin sma n=2 Tax=Caenorhabditis briggsae TaxID=6238 RepID=A0AAE9DUA6_CAEBR|nr:Protein CBR-TAG-68 [Caenorhabditis briggsae]ULU12127.1 hypothetical protein L3Y34_015460 [Caenorhabditis briggsae]UMM13077.1 hypothetical protein L5515_001537 [Caenorhabditis briggsae]CAP23339.1 Protein CBR-TAG-68 [Caenorhabditis briggsae]